MYVVLSSPQSEFCPKYPSNPPLIEAVGSEFDADVDTITGFNYGQLDLSPSVTDSPPRSIGACDHFFIPDADVASSSIVEEARRISSGSREVTAKIIGSRVEVQSSDPIEDFKRSMEEMMGAYHVDRGEPLDWEVMEDLLGAYLEVNERAMFRYIFAPFFDLTVEWGHRTVNGGG
ncbi:Transcription repressor OFP14 [Rhynchospora pubera]|uniref:Transcription repressor n=1 Tax=Rhynchospora pubera TaxID=906938 RepID=A0AAV8GSQ9_9POAL|nr:Transcription repressor OFP14 [Rhynchospora pubera]